MRLTQREVLGHTNSRTMLANTWVTLLPSPQFQFAVHLIDWGQQLLYVL